MREYKIVVLGSGGVGKSALTVKFVQNVFIDKYDPTIEDSYRKQTEIDNEQVVLEILDTAGTEQFTAMRDLYMKNGQGFLLVFALNSPSSLHDLNELHRQILQVKDRDRVPMIIVGNKCDLQHERTVQSEYVQQVANSWGCLYIETSAKYDTNVREIFHQLVRQIKREAAPKEGKGVRRKKTKCAIL